MMTKGINTTLLGTRLACSHLKRHHDPVQRICKKCGLTDEEREPLLPALKSFPETFDEAVGVLGHQDAGFKPTPAPGYIMWQEIKISPDEAGCQFNMISGEHLGECKGTCRGPD